MKAEHTQQIEILESKVKRALAAKDDTISRMNEDIEVKEVQIEKLKDMLEKARAQALGI